MKMTQLDKELLICCHKMWSSVDKMLAEHALLKALSDCAHDKTASPEDIFEILERIYDTFT